MICISNGLIPDLGGLAGENSGAENAAGNVPSSAEPVVQFSYDNTLEEIGRFRRGSRANAGFFLSLLIRL